MIEIICQVGIICTSLPAMYLLNNGKQAGSVYGLFGQVFWVTSTLMNNQWGMFALTFFFTYSYIIGTKRWLDERHA